MDGDINFAWWTLTGLQGGLSHEVCGMDVDRRLQVCKVDGDRIFMVKGEVRFVGWTVESSLQGGRPHHVCMMDGDIRFTR